MVARQGQDQQDMATGGMTHATVDDITPALAIIRNIP